MDISKIESGKYELIEDTYELAGLLNDISNIMTIRVKEVNSRFMSIGWQLLAFLVHMCFITFEDLSIAKCMFLLYEKKFQFNRMLFLKVVSDWILFVFFYHTPFFSAPLPHTICTLILVIYCISQFGFKLREFITNMELLYVLVGAVQLASWSIIGAIYFLIEGYWPMESYEGNLMINGMTLCVVWFLFPRLKLHKFSRFLQKKTILPQIILFLCFFYIASMIVIRIVDYSNLYPEQYVVVFVSIVLLFCVMYMWHKSYYKAKEQELQLEMHRMYNEGFEALISDIRKKQHDFQNHLNTIYSMHYTCHTYEELVEKQQAYVDAIQEENRYYKMLGIGNSVIVGFLYGKFLQADKEGIIVSYDVRIGNLESGIPIHKMVEVIGNLFDNAMEAIKNSEKEKTIYLKFVENPDYIIFTIKNESDYIPQEEQIKMFEKGQSTKGKHRGYGLANVKQICEQYKCDLQVRNRKENDNMYLEFQIIIDCKPANK